jgi:hypothetical protein
MRATKYLEKGEIFMHKKMDSGRVLILTSILLLLGIVIILAEGCARIPLSYVPGSVSKVPGNVSISDFKYLPAETGKVKPFQIRNTSLHSLKFDKDISIFFRDAVFAELLLAGVKVVDNKMVLGGDIMDFFIDEKSASADWTLQVRYLVKNTFTGEIVYISTKTTRRSVSKLASVNGAINEMIKLNVEELLKDEAFIKEIN